MSKVVIKKAESYDSGVVKKAMEDIFFHLAITKQAVQGKRILLKPNMLSKSLPIKAVTTHPEILRAVIELLLQLDVIKEDILIADSSGGPTSASILSANYKTTGYTQVAQDTGTRVYTQVQTKTLKTDGKIVSEFEILAPACDYDIIINLAKFKTHAMTGMSGAVKNIFGVVPGLKKAEFHMRFPNKDNFANMIVDLCCLVKPEYNIVDGIVAMEGDGPGSGTPRQVGVILASHNPYMLDLVISNMMSFSPRSLPILNVSIERGLVKDKIEDGDIIGDIDAFKPIENFIMPKSYSIDFSNNIPRAISWATPTIEKIIAPKPYIINKVCIGCQKCKDICPQRVITIKNNKAKIDLSDCIKCFCCHEVCPVKAIGIKRFILFNI